jgi:hypothetical protein
MKLYLKDFFSLDTLVGLVIFGCVAALLYLGARLLDEELGAEIERTGKVIGRGYTPSTTVLMHINDIATPIVTPDSYSLTVETKEGAACVPCSLYDYMNMHNGTLLRFTDKVGYFTGIRYKK